MRILQIDDDLSINEIMNELIKNAGHDCISFSNPSDAVKALYNEQFDLVITDYCMPVMSGKEIIELVNNLNYLTPVVMITGSEIHGIPYEKIKNGYFKLLKKPIRIREFYSILEHIEKTLEENILQNDLNSMLEIAAQ